MLGTLWRGRLAGLPRWHKRRRPHLMYLHITPSPHPRLKLVHLRFCCRSPPPRRSCRELCCLGALQQRVALPILRPRRLAAAVGAAAAAAPAAGRRIDIGLLLSGSCGQLGHLQEGRIAGPDNTVGLQLGMQLPHSEVRP